MILTCKDCYVTSQISHEQPHFSSPNYVKFCPCCGSNNCAVVHNDQENETWFELSKHLNIPVAAIKQLYELWAPTEGDNQNFVKWVKEKQNAKS